MTESKLKAMHYRISSSVVLVANGLFRHVERKDFCNTIFKGVDCGEDEGRFIDLAKQQSRG